MRLRYIGMALDGLLPDGFSTITPLDNGIRMDSLLTQIYHRQSARYRGLTRYKRWSVAAAAVLMAVTAGAWLLKPAAPVDLVNGKNLLKSGFFTQWQQGNVVVLLRHVERCDHSTNPCLAQLDGITTKGQAVALEMGKSIRDLGLEQTDIYNSPMLRTEQTSSFAFNRTSAGQDWLINCRKSMLNDVTSHKLDSRNMILVTHSECIEALEKSLHVAAPSSLDYGSSLIISIDPKTHAPHVLGYIDAHDWATVIAKRP
jgi:phosphohistidine phosphatase SixA